MEPGDVEARLGATWIALRNVQAFIADILAVPPDSVTIHYAAAIAAWTVELDYRAKYEVDNTTTYGTARFTAAALIDQGLDDGTPTAHDEQDDGSRAINQPETLAAREKLHEISARIRSWVWEEPQRAARLARIYNDQFNHLRLLQFH
jgi:N12 class adenine-specific DNA methylase